MLVTTVIVHAPGTDMATLVVAALGVGLALASLAWQAHTFFASGSRIRVEIRHGVMGAGAVVTFPRTPTVAEVQQVAAQGFTHPVLAVQVNNIGRGATSITSVEVVFDDGGSIKTTSPDPPLPFRLEGESEKTWYIDTQMAAAYVSTWEKVDPAKRPRSMCGRVQLGNRKSVKSRNTLPS